MERRHGDASDTALIVAVGRGDEQALAELYRRHAGVVLGMTRRIIAENYSHLTDPQARLTATIEENVLVQLEHLRTHPSVAAALSRDALTLHAWVYKFETGQVFAYEPESGQFSSLAEQGENKAGREELPSI